MLPIIDKEYLSYIDDKNQVELKVKPLCGSTEIEYLRIIRKAGIVNDQIENAIAICELFDLFVCGWKSTANEKLPAFPTDKKISEMFNLEYKTTVVNWIIENVNLTVDEKKS